MTVSATAQPNRPSEEAAAKEGERRALGVASGAHVLHDGYTDLVWVALPIWQAEFGLSYAAVGLLRTIYSGTLASRTSTSIGIRRRSWSRSDSSTRHCFLWQVPNRPSVCWTQCNLPTK
jgi:hypothetical protein